jgi:8-oxo-dGTP diphosphatase
VAKQRVTERLNDADFAFRMLPETFTMYELQRVYELFLGETLDKRNFRKKAQLQKENHRARSNRRDGPKT